MADTATTAHKVQTRNNRILAAVDVEMEMRHQRQRPPPPSPSHSVVDVDSSPFDSTCSKAVTTPHLSHLSAMSGFTSLPLIDCS
eukprot:scaffold2040_cov89-Skeletonema_dohrnii-CCMP3373.AAC.3